MFQREENRLKREENYVEFLQLCAGVAEELYPGELHTEICSATKNNGVEVTGLLLKRPGESVAPNFYLAAQYREWMSGQSNLEEIVRGMLAAYDEEVEKNRELAEAIRFDWEHIKPQVFARLVGRDRNEELLREIPYEEYLDMAVVYHYVIEVSEEMRGVLVMTNDHLRLLGITREELREAALTNTMKKMHPVITNMGETIVRLGKSMGIPVPWEMRGTYMYIMGNAEGNYGAVSMLFSKELEEFSNKIQSGFYILPSSVHEVILVPDYCALTADVFSGMVREVNATQLEATEVLTDSVYYYDRELHLVRRVA